ncbi:envelope stress response membrane protein PspC [Idiomarina xiamenensis]|uniref:Stress-responsive transcriptional regulator n=1 Tax=Idiomarina xiamenensis 10-D-4 TaxID=740709 RepID=K2KAD0_9GAMM|nr:envelope stress response membrane protein PspC [Idiomarina xiamenensis]EKE84763.1 stress-responsive transcriptional regulator [Idiomarina xiamenensis 10-D-4]
MDRHTTARGKLYRNSAEGKVAGVCAGIADYFCIETWIVRVIVLTGVFFTNGFVFIGYIALWFILDSKPPVKLGELESVRGHGVKTRIWEAGDPPSKAFQHIQQDMDELEQQLQRMETYVTSPQFSLNKELKKL